MHKLQNVSREYPTLQQPVTYANNLQQLQIPCRRVSKSFRISVYGISCIAGLRLVVEEPLERHVRGGRHGRHLGLHAVQGQHHPHTFQAILGRLVVPASMRLEGGATSKQFCGLKPNVPDNRFRRTKTSAPEEAFSTAQNDKVSRPPRRSVVRAPRAPIRPGFLAGVRIPSA